MPQTAPPCRKKLLIGCLMIIAGLVVADPARGQAVASAPSSVATPYGLTTLDWVIIAAYGVGMLGIGVYYACRTRNREDYLLGGRKMRSSPVGLSLFATLFSTITYLALPGEMISKGPVILWSMMAIPIAYVLVGYFIIPRFMELRVTSAYEILEARLGVELRLLAAIVFLVTRTLWMALIIYVTAEKIIVTMMDLPPDTAAWVTPIVAAVVGLLTVVYTSMGGLRAVVLTDVIQSIILLGGACLTIVLITIKMGGVTAWWPSTWSPNWDHQPFFSFDPTVRVTVIGSILFMTIWWIGTASSDQMAIQRYLATRDTKTARRVFLVTGLANILITTLLACVGFALLAFFSAHPDYLSAGTLEDKADIVFPLYIIHHVPPGLTGLILAALLAAAMSSLSSGVNSACSVISVDFIDRFRTVPTADSDAVQVKRIRIISFVSGFVAVVISLLMGQIKGMNIMEITVRTNHVFVAPLFMLFVMALFVRFATPIGAACGTLAGCAVAAVFACTNKVSFQWMSLAALLVDLAVAVPVSYWTCKEKPTESGFPAISRDRLRQ
ncbi:MAG: sodium:solute symporter family transporter [Phycisphaerae bacterium]